MSIYKDFIGTKLFIEVLKYDSVREKFWYKKYLALF